MWEIYAGRRRRSDVESTRQCPPSFPSHSLQLLFSSHCLNTSTNYIFLLSRVLHYILNLFNILYTYNSTDLIGQGAYGTVYRGTQRSTNRTVAIKRIPYADSTPEGGVPCNVIREISLLRELNHTNVVQLLDVIQATPGGGLYLVFEYVAHDLKTFMDQRQRSEDIRERIGLEQHRVRNFMRQILNGVGYCHTHRVLHRDLKPHNVSSYRFSFFILFFVCRLYYIVLYFDSGGG